MSILFVSCSKRRNAVYLDASARYRCFFPAEHLLNLGIQAHVTHIRKVDSLNLREYRYLVVHRPQFGKPLLRLMRKAQTAGIRLIADFDDFLFSPESAGCSPAVRSGNMTEREAQRQFSLYRDALMLFSHCWVSTDTLKHQVQRYVPDCQVDVVHNRVPPRWAMLAEPRSSDERLAGKVIRYLPGTSHHTHDFTTILPALNRLLDMHDDISLEIIGDLKLRSDELPKNRVTFRKYLPYEDLPEVIAESWLTIAPLAANTFNNCKSALKFWESGLMGVPLISSPLPDAERFPNAGLRICRTEAEWLSAFTDMLDPDTYRTASSQARATAKCAIFDRSGDRRIELLGDLRAYRRPEPNNDSYWQTQQLWMKAHFGNNWPETVLSPTDPQFSLAFETLDRMPQDLTRYTDELEAMCLNSTIGIHEPDMSEVIYRKMRKLYRNPRLFFADSYRKWFR